MIKLCNGLFFFFLIDLRDIKGIYIIFVVRFLFNIEVLRNLRFCEVYFFNFLSLKLLVDFYKRIYDFKIFYRVFYDIKGVVNYCNEMKNIYGGN